MHSYYHKENTFSMPLTHVRQNTMHCHIILLGKNLQPQSYWVYHNAALPEAPRNRSVHGISHDLPGQDHRIQDRRDLLLHVRGSSIHNDIWNTGCRYDAGTFLMSASEMHTGYSLTFGRQNEAVWTDSMGLMKVILALVSIMTLCQIMNWPSTKPVLIYLWYVSIQQSLIPTKMIQD